MKAEMVLVGIGRKEGLAWDPAKAERNKTDAAALFGGECVMIGDLRGVVHYALGAYRPKLQSDPRFAVTIRFVDAVGDVIEFAPVAKGHVTLTPDAPEPVTPKRTPVVTTCKRCGVDIPDTDQDATDDLCAACCEVLEEEADDTPPPVTCTRCGREMSVDDSICDCDERRGYDA